MTNSTNRLEEIAERHELTVEQIEVERQLFESTKKGRRGRFKRFTITGLYVDPDTQYKWLGWLARATAERERSKSLVGLLRECSDSCLSGYHP